MTEKLVFYISPLIKITLLSLYFALTIPLPFLTQVSSVNVPISSWLFWVVIVLGAVIIFAVLSEQVILDTEKIQVCYPYWVRLFLGQGWSLLWSEIKDLKMRSTGQGGLVYYFITQQEDRAYLLPMRIAGFAKMLQEIQVKTGLNTNDIRPLSQPWMYLILLVFTSFLLLIDVWIIFNAIS